MPPIYPLDRRKTSWTGNASDLFYFLCRQLIFYVVTHKRITQVSYTSINLTQIVLILYDKYVDQSHKGLFLISLLLSS